MKIETEFSLLLTASIDPKGMPGVSRPDPNYREQTYADCFEYYLRNHPRVQKIIFAENSGWPLDRFHQLAGTANVHAKEVEVLSFDCNDFPRDKGKSYGELLLIENALDRSQLAESARFVGKLTGRNFLLNLTRVLETLPGAPEFYCDIRDHNFYQMLGMPDCGHHCDTRFFVMTRHFYDRYIRHTYATLPFESNYMLEGFLYDLIKENEHREKIIKRFRVEPDYRGAAGHFMKNKPKDYGSPAEIWKRRIRSCSRRVAPWLYI
jgi:hypothetical protein